MSPRNKKLKSLASPKKQLGQAKRKLITMTKNDAFFETMFVGNFQSSVKVQQLKMKKIIETTRRFNKHFRC